MGGRIRPTAGVASRRALAYAATLFHTSERPPFPMRQTLISVFLAAGTTALTLMGCGSTEPPVPTTVQIDSSSLSFGSIGETRQLTAAVKDQRGDPFGSPAITWSVANTAVATVDGSGLVTATGPGITQVTATDESATATINVQVVQVPKEVQKVSGDGQSGPPGQELPGALDRTGQRRARASGRQYHRRVHAGRRDGDHRDTQRGHGRGRKSLDKDHTGEPLGLCR